MNPWIRAGAWLLILGGFLVAFAAHLAAPLDPEDDPTCPDEVDGPDDLDGCESWPTWFEEAS